MTGDVGPAVSSWPHRHGLSLGRGAALAALSAVGLLCFVPMAVAAALGAGGAVLGLRRLPLLRRRLAGAWCGVDIPAPYAPPVSAPLPREGGWYRQGRRLYASDKAALRKRRARQVSRDRATLRDLVWLLADPVLCAPVALLPAVLVGSGLGGSRHRCGGRCPGRRSGRRCSVCRWCSWASPRAPGRCGRTAV
ncbi:hypothetical protein H0E86_00690 [Streptomyces sp. SCSIO-PteL053]|nr:hypothetical protein H0E86_00690 [Streptomyces sp. SCSIO-PteL053]